MIVAGMFFSLIFFYNLVFGFFCVGKTHFFCIECNAKEKEREEKILFIYMSMRCEQLITANNKIIA